MGGVEGCGEDIGEGGEGREREVGEGGGVYLVAERVDGCVREGGYVVGVDYEEGVGGFDYCWRGVSSWVLRGEGFPVYLDTWRRYRTWWCMPS